jgi:hypothetical protein
MKNIALMILTLLVTLSACSKSTSPSKDSIEDRGDVIVSALAKFKKDSGHFPSTLDGLVPKYLKQIDPPFADGPPWKYNASSSGASFTLTFENLDRKYSDLPRVLIFNSELNQWFRSAFK